jgi:hypothetical protein
MVKYDYQGERPIPKTPKPPKNVVPRRATKNSKEKMLKVYKIYV